jgi:hypothetical protein
VKALDLIPPEVVHRRAIRDRIWLWSRRLAVTAMAAAFVYTVLYVFVAIRSAELEGLEQRYGMLGERLQRAGAILGERDRLASNYEAVAVIQGGYGTSEILRSLDNALPADCYLKVFVMHRCPVLQEEPTDPRQDHKDETASKLKVLGVAQGHREVGQIMQHLIHSGVFADVRLVWTRDASGTETPTQTEFEIECTLADEEAPDQAERGGYLEAGL